jgi:hypothetical protein
VVEGSTLAPVAIRFCVKTAVHRSIWSRLGFGSSILSDPAMPRPMGAFKFAGFHTDPSPAGQSVMLLVGTLIVVRMGEGGSTFGWPETDRIVSGDQIWSGACGACAELGLDGCFHGMEFVPLKFGREVMGSAPQHSAHRD